MCEIKKSTLGRLPAYLEFLYGIKDKRETISTSAIADALSFGSVQVKKDLSSVGNKGKPKIGYKTAELIEDIEKAIKDVNSGIVLVGVGKIGEAILNYGGFNKFGLKISAASLTSMKNIWPVLTRLRPKPQPALSRLTI